MAASEPTPRAKLEAFLGWLGGARPADRPGAGLRLTGLKAGGAVIAARLAETDEAPLWWDARWQGVDFADVDMAGAHLSGADLSHANLKRAVMTDANGRLARLDDALIEEADFSDGDFGGASFRDAVAGQAIFRRAMLEDARFGGASMRFAELQEALLDGADFEGADGWGASFAGADADRTSFRKARLDEADLSDANLTFSDFSGASLKRTRLAKSRLRGAVFANATLSGTDLTGADLSDTKLVRLDLSTCQLRHIRLAGAWIEGCRIRVEQLGGAVGEEVAGDYEGAKASYTALEANFASIGAKAEAGWAYKRGRKMGCLGAGAKARAAFRQRAWKTVFVSGYHWAADRFVEWLCDYGESMSRIVRAFVMLILVFAALYGISGGLVPEGAPRATRNVVDLLSYSALNMMTSNPPEIGLSVVGRFANILVGLQGAIGIILMGLFGYILGNRIRR
ncbi:hypothetical protein ASG54_24380 [Aureimonas sp. Leaf460]|nr:hypothetical protein ASG54_24380 [Aureimonas sp. Leaf460]KQT68750.1 hypothetical protein ASG62_19140 [Aureimonas sp. Leaf427]